VAEPDSFDFGGFDEAYDISDFGEDQAFSTSEMAPVTTMFGGGNFVDVGLGDDGDSLSSILNPALGSGNRTNITNVGAGSNLVYDPAFAAALDIRRNIDPTLNLGGTGGLAVPAALRPQIAGEFMDSDLGEADMVRPMFFSQGEKFLQQTLPEIVRSGPIARLARGIGNILSEGRDFAADATAGIKLPSLQEIGQGFTNFMNRFRPERTVTKSDETAVMGSLNPTDRFPSDMRQVPISTSSITGNQMMNTGIAQVQPNMANQANMAVADALQLIPQGTLADSIGVRNQVAQALNPELKAFIDRQPPLEDRMAEINQRRKERQREDDFRKDVIQAIETRNNMNNRDTGILDQNFINRTLNPTPFDNTGTFINLDNV